MTAPPPTQAPSPLLALRDVSKTFDGGVAALDALSLEVEHGAFVSLLGPSGCGKSTVLRLIAGLAQPSAGRIDRHARGAALGVVFQEPTLAPWSRVFENVWLPLRLKGVSRKAAERDVLDALDLVGLSGFETVYPRALSGGMKMRVSIARALVTRPSLLLMDEPFAALDEITRFKLNDDLIALRRRLGCTVISVTHSVFESVFLSDRVAVMTARPGRVAEEIAIAAPAGRGAAFRMSADYARQCGRVSEALGRAMAAQAA